MRKIGCKPKARHEAATMPSIKKREPKMMVVVLTTVARGMEDDNRMAFVKP